MSLGSLYQPNASWSMGTVNHSLYVKNLNEIIEKLKEEN
jgi:CO dehydrogenase/acetyl-CoA synthase epsilon subunit